MNISDGINKIGEVSDNISELLSSKREFVIKQISNIFLLLIILIVFGCFDWMHLTFHFEYLANPNFWINIATKAAADVASYNIGINVIIDDAIKRNKTLQKLKEIYDNLNNYKEEDFEEFIFEYNKECKIIAYKNYINYKIYKLNKHSKKSDKLMYNSKLVSEEDKLKNKYCVERQELEDLKSDEYIKNNIESLEIRYRDIDASIFEIEINGTEKVVQNKVTGSVSKGRVAASISTLLSVIFVPIIFNAIGLDPSGEELQEGAVAAVNYMIKIASDIGIIIWQFTRGILGTHKIVSQQITNPLAERVKILKKYYSWKLKNGKSVPQYYLDLTKEVEYKEITIEQYNEIGGN